MYGFASALSGAPALAPPRTHAARRTRGRNNDRRRIVAPRCSISEPEPTADASAASPDRGCDPADPNDCIVTPRKVVNGQDLPAFEDVSTAHFRIRNGVVRTPLVKSRALSAITGMKIFLKHEWQQATGSFKERGARNSLLALSAEQRARGVVAASAGNHALALAYHGAELGIPSPC